MIHVCHKFGSFMRERERERDRERDRMLLPEGSEYEALTWDLTLLAPVPAST